MMKFGLFKKFKKWTLPTKFGVIVGGITIISVFLFSPIFPNGHYLYKYVIDYLFESDCEITFLDKGSGNKSDYNPDYAVSSIITNGRKNIPNETKLKLKQGDICGTVNTEIQLPGQRRPYNLGDLDIDNYTIVLPLPLVFITNVRDDNIIVDQMAERLIEEDAILTWIDRKDLLPGVEWKKEVKEAIEKADKFLYFFSGFDSKEDSLLYISLKSFMNSKKLSKQIIPILINEIPIPPDLNKIIWLEMWENGSYEKLVTTIKSQS